MHPCNIRISLLCAFDYHALSANIPIKMEELCFIPPLTSHSLVLVGSKEAALSLTHIIRGKSRLSEAASPVLPAVVPTLLLTGAEQEGEGEDRLPASG